MQFLAIDKSPYAVYWALFHYESRRFISCGSVCFYTKTETERTEEMWDGIESLLNGTNPNVVVSHWLDLRHILKKDLEHAVQVKTILRKLCLDKNIIYNEFKTDGWEKRLVDMKKPSPKAKLEIARQYSPNLDSVGIANAIILGESVVWNRLQIGRQ